MAGKFYCLFSIRRAVDFQVASADPTLLALSDHSHWLEVVIL